MRKNEFTVLLYLSLLLSFFFSSTILLVYVCITEDSHFYLSALYFTLWSVSVTEDISLLILP